MNKPADTDRVYYSELKEWYTNNAFRSFSIKYVVEGAINYRNGNKTFRVQENQFLLTSKQPYAKAYFESRQPVKSICIDICPASIAETFSVLEAGNDHNLDNYQAGYFEYPHFFEKIYQVGNTGLSAQLKQLALAIYTGGHYDEPVNEEWFLLLTEQIVLQEKSNCRALDNLFSKKASTKKEIYERLLSAKEFIHAHYLQNPGIAVIAKAGNLSVYHFFRSFRRAFNMSPYQYMLCLRLEHALYLLKKGNVSITDIAGQCGFPDVFTFSKSFKKQYGLSPRNYIRSIFSSTVSKKL